MERGWRRNGERVATEFYVIRDFSNWPQSLRFDFISPFDLSFLCLAGDSLFEFYIYFTLAMGFIFKVNFFFSYSLLFVVCTTCDAFQLSTHRWLHLCKFFAVQMNENIKSESVQVTVHTRFSARSLITILNDLHSYTHTLRHAHT